MDVKEAVSTAKHYIREVFQDENPADVGLEEIELDEPADAWLVTIGFSRPWSEPKNALAAIANAATPRRSYKVVRIANATRKLLSVKDRDVRE